MGSLTLVRDDTRGVLTDRQREILDFITQSIRERGYPPTLREIGLHFGIRSTNGVNDHLRALEKKGYLQREDLKSRALRPVGAARPDARAQPRRGHDRRAARRARRRRRAAAGGRERRGHGARSTASSSARRARCSRCA